MLQHSIPKIMGILNCTPDSFYDGGKYESFADQVDRGLAMIDTGADWIDIGGESTRPQAKLISIDEELKRVIPVIEEIRRRSTISISIDTTKAKVALESVQAGANMINDVSALTEDPEMPLVTSELAVPVILTHRRGTPETMQNLASYQDVVKEVQDELELLIKKALNAGITNENILIDPGFGFSKTTEQNIQLLKHLDAFKKINYPLVIGLSRKSFIGKITGQEDPQNRLYGSLAGAMYAALKGAAILRVHDVFETYQMVQVLKVL